MAGSAIGKTADIGQSDVIVRSYNNGGTNLAVIARQSVYLRLCSRSVLLFVFKRRISEYIRAKEHIRRELPLLIATSYRMRSMTINISRSCGSKTSR